LEITGIKQVTHVVNSLDEAKQYAREHFPQVLNFVREQKQKKEVREATQGQTIDTKTWKFFDDEEKKHINIENILQYAILTKASDVHISVGKPITYRTE
jgi:type II secretory ATPase GspE/PulE/Tfp pilus assembly ATPase PilB-like protein